MVPVFPVALDKLIKKYNKLMKSIFWTKREHLNYPKKVKTNVILTYMIKSLFTTSCKI